jgi:hypothetical protein
MNRIVLAILCLALALPALAQAPPPPAPVLAVDEAAFGTGVTDRVLDNPTDRFTVGERAYLWTSLTGGAPGDTIQHVWHLDDVEIQAVRLHVDASTWRTWSYKTLYPGQTGTWRVDVRDAADGRLLGSWSFTCAAAPAEPAPAEPATGEPSSDDSGIETEE